MPIADCSCPQVFHAAIDTKVFCWWPVTAGVRRHNHNSFSPRINLRSAACVRLIAVVVIIVCTGCDSLTTPSIAGKWKADAVNTIEIPPPDGMLRDSAALNTGNGTYVILHGNRIETEIDGILRGTNVSTRTYDIDGNGLKMSTEGGVGITMISFRVN